MNQKQEILFNQLESIAQIGYWEVDLISNQLHWSDGVYRMLGYEPQSFAINFVKRSEVIHPDDRERATSHFNEVLEKRGKYAIQKRFISADGSIIHILSKAEFIFDDKNNPIKLLGVFQNITELVNANVKLLEETNLTQELIQNLPNVFFMFNDKGKFVIWNNRLLEVSEYTNEEVSEMSPLDFFDDESKKVISEHISKVISEGETNIEVNFISKSKISKPIHFVASKFRYKDEICIYGVGIDISERKKAEEQLFLSEKRFKSLVQNGADLIAILSLGGDFQYVSPNYRTILGYSEEELLGKNGFDYFHPDDVEVVKPQFSELEVKRRVTSNPYRFRRKDGTYCWMQSVGTNLFEDSSIQGIVVNSVDISDLVETQNALNHSNQRFSMIMRAGSESIWDYDLVNDELFLGVGFKKNFGIEPESLNSNNELFNSILHPLDKKMMLTSFKKALDDSSQMEWSKEYRIKKSNGDYAYVLDKAIILRSKKGDAYRVVGAIKDITNEYFYRELDQIEREILEISLSGKSSLVSLLNLYMVRLQNLFPDMKASILKVHNGKLMNFVSPSMPRPYLKAIDGLEIGDNVGSCGTAAYTKKEVIVEDVFNDKRWKGFTDFAKKYGFVACWSQPILNSNNDVIATFTNYYETKRTPNDRETHAFDRSQRFISLIFAQYSYIDNIQKSNERFERVTEATNDAIWDWNIVKKKMYWSNGFNTLFGYDVKKEVPSFESWISHVHKDDIDVILERLNEAILDVDRINWENEYRYLKADGTYAHVLDKGKIIRDEKGKAIRMVGAMSDMTQRKQNEESLKQLNDELEKNIKDLAASNKELEQFAYVASHDLQEPLRMVTGFLSQLEKKYSGQLDDKAKTYIHYAVDGASRMHTIILDLLEYSRAGQLVKHEFEPVDLDHIIEDVKILLKKSIEESGTELRVEKLPEIMAASPPMRQVFQNILGNAIKYRSKDKKPIIIVRAEKDKTYHQIIIEDNGIGISPEYHSKIFELFQRLHTREEYGGTGIGLAITKKIIESFGGHILVHSEKDLGSKFILRIPIIQPKNE